MLLFKQNLAFTVTYMALFSDQVPPLIHETARLVYELTVIPLKKRFPLKHL